MNNKGWHHYKDGKLIGIMKFDSLPQKCQDWYAEHIEELKKRQLKQEDLIFIDSAIDGECFDDMMNCQLPCCVLFCESERMIWDVDLQNNQQLKNKLNKEYLDNLRQDLIKHPDNGYEEYIIYK